MKYIFCDFFLLVLYLFWENGNNNYTFSTLQWKTFWVWMSIIPSFAPFTGSMTTMFQKWIAWFQEFLADETILKVGVGPIEDSNYLAMDYNMQVYHIFILCRMITDIVAEIESLSQRILCGMRLIISLFW